MSSVSISRRPLYLSPRSCNFVRADSPRTVATTLHPFFRNSPAIARPRPREAATSKMLWAACSEELSGADDMVLPSYVSTVSRLSPTRLRVKTAPDTSQCPSFSDDGWRKREARSSLADVRAGRAAPIAQG